MRKILLLGVILLLATSVQLGVAQPSPWGGAELAVSRPGRCAADSNIDNSSDCNRCCNRYFGKSNQRADYDDCVSRCDDVHL